MGITYERANNAIQALVAKTMEACHPDLHKQGVTVDCLVVRREDKRAGEVHALRRNGYPLYAKIQITSLADRALGRADVKLIIDAFSWKRLSDRRRAALLDHELQHLGIAYNKPTKRNGYDNLPKVDDLGRPMLKSRPHDWEISGFEEVVKRHGEHSIEALHFENFRDQFGQLNLFGPSVLAVVDGTAKKKPRLRSVKGRKR